MRKGCLASLSVGFRVPTSLYMVSIVEISKFDFAVEVLPKLIPREMRVFPY